MDDVFLEVCLICVVKDFDVLVGVSDFIKVGEIKKDKIEYVFLLVLLIYDFILVDVG